VSRYLFVFPPFVGHVNPAAGVAAELQQRGHEVAWVAHEDVVGPLLGADAAIYPAGDGFLGQVIEHLDQRERVKGVAALQFLWDRVLVPLALDMVDPVRAAVDQFRPDVVVADQQTFAGSIVAAQLGITWAVSACSTAELVAPLSLVPKVATWMQDQLDGLYAKLGMPELGEGGFDPRFSPRLVIEYSTLALVGEVERDLGPVAFVGPVPPPRRPDDPVPFPWEWLEQHETNVFVSLGTLSQDIGEPFLCRVRDAVAGQPYGVVMVSPDESPTNGTSWPGNVVLRSFVPQYDLLPHMQAVLCHGGHNTTVGALALGIPVVCAPIRDDQPVTAAQVVRAGAGRRLKFTRSTPADIADAIDAVLYDPSYRDAAGRIARSFEAAGGAPAAADRLELLAH
jgi:UDP:flavonoid glycosyltransferase YjiC (YdhE family)